MATIERQAKTVQRLRNISRLLDNAIPIPGTPYRIGLDPLLGLLPAGGDLAGALLSAYIVFSAAQLGLPRESLVRMVSNILLETVVGTIPIVGDLFDVAWKANIKNMELLESHLDTPQPAKKADKTFIALLLIGLLVFVVAAIAFSAWLITVIFGALLR
ncbi:DUF4112 domain-containing protein [Oxynema aestuarii]|jgi:hypothetical protein|uniref:DUF4112 domain-containing protein n=1 Tax=Oxynema aestuarii AP17 TaxID=2064643 RepID=A0A6H1TVQ5_9CYAN|nr:DUF4112 domain-containing protein [Oxynema aestuarii]QIZ70286.1 DUF4112 domain-containing protein [Oxynema aestuarii AP17]RMH73430.1 MAG: DUF4112 domain-containing protein [Cyanobacteria bacterium J007]